MKQIIFLFFLLSLVGTDSFSQSRLSVDLLRTQFREDPQNTESFQMDDDLGLRVSYLYDYPLTQRLNLEMALGYNLIYSGYSGPYVGIEYFTNLGCRIDGPEIGINMRFSVKKFQIVGGLTSFYPIGSSGIFGKPPRPSAERIRTKSVLFLLNLNLRYKFSKRFQLGGTLRYCPLNIINETTFVSSNYYIEVKRMSYRDQGISLYYIL